MPDICVRLPGEFFDHTSLISQLQLPRPPVCFCDLSTRAWKGFYEDSFRRELLASAFVSATGGIFWHTGQRAARTIRYHATRPPGQTRSRVELHVTDVSRLHPGSMPTVPRPSAGQGCSNGGIGGRSWILIGWSGLDKPRKNNNCSPPNKISSGRRKFPTARATPRNYGGIFRVIYERSNRNLRIQVS